MARAGPGARCSSRGLWQGWIRRQQGCRRAAAQSPAVAPGSTRPWCSMPGGARWWCAPALWLWPGRESEPGQESARSGLQ